MDVVTLLLTIVAATNSALAILLLFSMGKSTRVGIVYSVNIVAILSWIGAMLFYRLANPEYIVELTKLLYISASLIASTFLYFSFTFPRPEKDTLLTKALIIVPNVLLIALVWFGNTIIDTADVVQGGENVIYFGPLYAVYVLYILFYFMYSFWRLFQKYLKTENAIEKRQIIYLLIGYVVSANIAFVTNLILPWVGVFNFNWVGQVATILMVIFAIYSILRHQLFNVQVIGAELLVVGLEIFILVRTVLAEDRREQIINGALFVITTIFGIFLIRAVMQQVKARQRIMKLAHDLARANEKLKVLDRRKSEFISIATHQIRSPLAAIKGYASLVLEGSYGAVPPKLVEPVERILHSSTALAYVVNDFLDISRIELNRMKYEYAEVDLIEVISDVIDDLKSSIDKKGLAVTFEEPKDGPYLAKVDAGKIRQVIGNLVDNSVKYTVHGCITIIIRKEEHKYHVCVKDTGIGMSPETLAVLFEKFTRAKEASKTNIMGTGLGLFVAKQLIEHHGGKIWAASDGENRGSEFHVEIPKIAINADREN